MKKDSFFFKIKLQKKKTTYILNKTKIKHILLFFIKEAKYNKLDDIVKKLYFLKINEISLIKILKKTLQSYNSTSYKTNI